MKIIALIADTFREIYARKAILGIVIIELLALVITGSVLFMGGMQRNFRNASQAEQMTRPDSARLHARPERPDPEEDSLLGGAEEPDTGRAGKRSTAPSITFQAGPGDSLKAPHEFPQGALLHEMVKGELSAYAAAIFLAVIFLGIFATAGIIPSMMEKGNIDLLVSKPVSRTTLLFGRAIGGFAALAINLTFFVLAVWALYGIASGIWYFPFVYWTVAITLFSFLVLYSAILLLNVITESSVLPMILVYIHLMVLSNFLSSRETLLFQFITNDTAQNLITGLYHILPQTSDLLRGLPLAVANMHSGSAEPFIQGTAFAIVMLGLASWRIERKDF